MARLISNSTAAIASWLRRRRHRPKPGFYPHPEGAQRKREWADSWQDRGTTDNALIREWKERWERRAESAKERRRHLYTEPAEDSPRFDEDPLDKYKGLLKYESSALIQMRTGKIGLNSFLHRRQVPDIGSPLYSCGRVPETVCHLTIECPETARAREKLAEALGPTPLRTSRDFATALRHPFHAQIIVRWFLGLNRLKEYRVALRIGGRSGKRRKRDNEAAGNRYAPNSARYLRVLHPGEH